MTEQTRKIHPVWIWFWLGALLTVLLPLTPPLFGLPLFDQHRLMQIIIFTLVATGSPLLRRRSATETAPVSRMDRICLATVLALGLCSAARARQPLWALTEISLITMCVALGWTVFTLRKQHCGALLDRALLTTVFFLCSVMTVKFLSAYAASITSGFGSIDTRSLLQGFPNIRMYGQFQTLTLPLLVWPLLAKGIRRRWQGAAIVLGIMWWTQAIASGTRGTWLGLAFAAAAMAALCPTGRRWAKWQLAMAAGGLVLFYLIMTWIPGQMHTAVENHATARITTSLTGRDFMWRRAAELTLQRPLLGVGPMHYADASPPVPGASPHQALLQWAAEWGLPSLFIVCGLLMKAAWATARVLQKDHASHKTHALYGCLAAAILASSTQAMVDGVIAAPYSQLWLAIIGGWLLALHPTTKREKAVSSPWQSFVWHAIITAATATLCYIAARDLPMANQRITQYVLHVRTHDRETIWLRPRFWVQGLIADIDKTD